jgi:hypothetical protein
MGTPAFNTRVLAYAAIGFAIVSLAACGEAGPTAPARHAGSLRAPVVAVRPSFDISGLPVELLAAGDTAYGTFTVSPSAQRTYMIGGTSGSHAITFPAGAICEPETSSYGPTEWDQPCTPATRDVRISVKAYRANGSARVDFSPALRFVPERTVTLYLNDAAAARTGLAGGLLRGTGSEAALASDVDADAWAAAAAFKRILYCTDAGLCVDESLGDATLETFYDADTQLLARRVKHFSGYTIAVGRGGEMVD